MSAGQRNTRVSFYRPTVTGQNSSGEDVVTNTLLGSAWVDIRSLQGREKEQAQQLQAVGLYKVTMDHPLSTFTLQRKDFILWGSPGRTLSITDIEEPRQMRRELILTALEFAS